MPHILAIEAVPARAQRLRALVGDYVHADLTIVESVPDAIEALAALTPDVVIVPTLLAPDDERALMARIRELPSPHVQTLTIPSLEMIGQDEKPRPRRLRRRRQAPPTSFDPRLAAARIAEGLERARAARDEQQWARVTRVEQVEEPPQLMLVKAESSDGRAASLKADERRRAPRIEQTQLPWLSGVRTPWGLDLRLLNISSTGLLVESTSKLSPGVTYEMHLHGDGTAHLVKARIVRTDIRRVDALGVLYCAAAAFDRTLDWIARQEARAAAGAAQALGPEQALAELLLEVVSEKDSFSGETADLRFARGLRRLLGARDVLVRRTPVSPVDGSESIYFRVGGHGPAQRILQVLFDPDRALTETEFRLLKAAAPMTAAVLELNRPVAGSAPLAITA